MRRHAASALVAITIVLAASATAVVSHVLIDALGDVLLRDDSYDHVAHASRLVALAGAAALAALVLLRVWCAAFGEARSARGTMRATLAHAARRSAAPSTYAATIALALAAIAGMETLDVARAGGSVRDFADALGGSAWLGLGVTSVAGALAAWSVARILRALGRAYAALVVVVREAILAVFGIASRAAAFARRRHRPRAAGSALRSCRACKRGPPLRSRAA